jgi:hypothetical protein
MAQNAFTPGTSTVEAFFGWINERHSIFLKRKAGKPKPWTDDAIMREYKFTNAFRELDTGTIALRNMEKSTVDALALEQDPERAMTLCKRIVFNTFWYRTFNWYEHAEKLGMVSNYGQLEEYFMGLHRRGERIFTGAHMVRGDGPVKLFPYLKLLHQVWDNLDVLTWTIINEGSMKFAFNQCMEFYLVGKFNAYELVCDWRFSLGLDSDCLTWGSIGPGAARGLQRLGLPGKDVSEMVELWKVAPLYLKGHVIDHFPKNWSLSRELGGSRVIITSDREAEYPPFEIREIEHSLCEFDKYERCRQGQGRPRQKYPGV